jgi:hypothetical protein
MVGFGVLGIGSSLVIGSFRVLLEGFPGFIRYRRFIGGEMVVDERISIGRGRRISFRLTPFYPVMIPRRITSYILVEYSGALWIPPRGKAIIYLYIPVDYAVYVYRGKTFSVIDFFEAYTVKYALYGSINRGLVARYIVSDIYHEKPEPLMGRAVVKTVIENTLDEWVKNKQLLLNVNNLALYYKPETWEAYTQEIYMTINSHETATIRYGDVWIENVVRIDDPSGFKPPKILGRTDMLWGI